MNNLIYTDACSEVNRKKIKDELGVDIVLGIDSKVWTFNDSLNIVMLPDIELVVINIINEITVMEIGLLHFMCKPILITSRSITSYPILKNKVVDFISLDSDLRSETSTFIDWYKSWEK